MAATAVAAPEVALEEAPLTVGAEPVREEKGETAILIRMVLGAEALAKVPEEIREAKAALVMVPAVEEAEEGVTLLNRINGFNGRL